jgi:hypothetical protein
MVCNKDLNLASTGIAAVQRHAVRSKHIDNEQSCENAKSVTLRDMTRKASSIQRQVKENEIR